MMTTKPYPTEQTAFTDETKGDEMLHKKKEMGINLRLFCQITENV